MGFLPFPAPSRKCCFRFFLNNCVARLVVRSCGMDATIIWRTMNVLRNLFEQREPYMSNTCTYKVIPWWTGRSPAVGSVNAP